jgi:hypothetical protein
VRPSEKTAFRVISGPSPQGLSPPLGHPAERRALHARGEGKGLTGAYFLLPTVPSLTHVFEMKGHGIRPARIHGRGDRAPPRKSPFALFPGISPLGHLTLDSPSPRRGGLRTPARKALASPGHIAARPPVVRSPLGDHVIPRLASGSYWRTHGVRPSEKTAFRVVSGSAPVRRFAFAWPFRGGAGSARPQ